MGFVVFAHTLCQDLSPLERPTTATSLLTITLSSIEHHTTWIYRSDSAYTLPPFRSLKSGTSCIQIFTYTVNPFEINFVTTGSRKAIKQIDTHAKKVSIFFVKKFGGFQSNLLGGILGLRPSSDERGEKWQRPLLLKYKHESTWWWNIAKMKYKYKWTWVEHCDTSKRLWGTHVFSHFEHDLCLFALVYQMSLEV